MVPRRSKAGAPVASPCLRSIRELTESSASILTEARGDVEAATSAAQAAIEPPVVPDHAPVVASTTAEAETMITPETSLHMAPAIPAAQPSNGTYGDPFDAAEVKRRETAAREAAARITGGGA